MDCVGNSEQEWYPSGEKSVVRLPPSRLAINPLLIEWAGYHAGGFAHRDLKSAFVAGHLYPMTVRVGSRL